MLKTMWEDHRELFVVLFGMFALVLGLIVEFWSEDSSYIYAHEIGYATWVVCYVYWVIAISKKTQAFRLHYDSRSIKDMSLYRRLDAGIEYFFVDESNHTIVNWWRKLRGKITIRLYKARYLSHASALISRTTYVVNKKQLFEMRLRGFTENASDEVALAALEDEWLRQFKSWFS